MDHRQVFTRREIEKDLKYTYRRGLGISIGIFPLVVILWLLVVSMLSLSSKEILEAIGHLILTILFSIIDVCEILYYAIKVFTPIKYEVVTDTFEYQTEYFSRCAAHLTFQFKCYGEYLIIQSSRNMERYYRWSKDCRLWGNQFKDCAQRGEEFYLIIVDGKIHYIYSTRIFKFVEAQKKQSFT